MCEAEDHDCPAHALEAQRLQQEQENTAAVMADENAKLRAALREVEMVLSLEHTLRPDYGWREWLDYNVRPLLRPNASLTGGRNLGRPG